MSGRSDPDSGALSRLSVGLVCLVIALSVSARRPQVTQGCDVQVLRINRSSVPRRRRLEGGVLFDCPSARWTVWWGVCGECGRSATGTPSLPHRRSLCSQCSFQGGSAHEAVFGSGWPDRSRGGRWCRPPHCGLSAALVLGHALSTCPSSACPCGRAGCLPKSTVRFGVCAHHRIRC